MGFSDIFGGDKTSSQSQTFDPRQAAEFDLLTSGAAQQFRDGGFFASDPFGGIDPIAGRTADQSQLLKDLITGSTGTARQAQTSLASALGPFDPNNQALQASIDLVGRDITENLQENLLPAVGQGAIGAGQFGGSRQGVAESIALENAGEQFADAATRMRFQDQSAFQDRQQQLLSNLGSVQQGITGAALGVGDIERSDRQAQIDVELEKFARESGLPLANLQAFRDLISGNMGGTTTGSVTEEGSGIGELLGSMATTAAPQLAAVALSDSRLKTNIKKLGQFRGKNLYSWDWEDGRDSYTVGVIAQEHVGSGAVVEVDGYLAVDYQKLFN